MSAIIPPLVGATFEAAIPTILRHEGGWVNNPVDPGGETNFGISMKMVKDQGITAAALGIPNLEPGAMKLMTVETATEIYRKYFWDARGYGRLLDQGVATKVFDCAVNCGPDRAHKLAQKAANRLGAQLTVDGDLGPASIAAINAIAPESFRAQLAGQMEIFYRAIVAAHPAQSVFLSNWLRRASA